MNDLELMYFLEEEGYEPDLENLLILKEELEREQSPAEKTYYALKRLRKGTDSITKSSHPTPEEINKRAKEIIERRRKKNNLNETSKAQLRRAHEIIRSGNASPQEGVWASAAIAKHKAGKTASGAIKQFDRTLGDLRKADADARAYANDPSKRRTLETSKALHKSAEQSAVSALADGIEYGKIAKENKK